MSAFNFEKPFIAIRKDEEGTEFERTMGEYLCNPLVEDLLDVRVSTGGFYSDPELGVITGEGKNEPAVTLPAGKAVRFTLSTWDEYREMALHWSVSYRLASGAVVRLSFATYKNLEDCEHFKEVPVLGGGAFVVPND